MNKFIVKVSPISEDEFIDTLRRSLYFIFDDEDYIEELLYAIQPYCPNEKIELDIVEVSDENFEATFAIKEDKLYYELLARFQLDFEDYRSTFISIMGLDSTYKVTPEVDLK